MSNPETVVAPPLYKRLSVARPHDESGQWQRPYALHLKIDPERYLDISKCREFSHSPEWNLSDEIIYAINKAMDGRVFYHSFKVPTGGIPFYWHIASKYETLPESDVFPEFELYLDREMVWSSDMEQALVDKAHHKERLGATREELTQVSMHPRRLARHLELGGEIEDF